MLLQWHIQLLKHFVVFAFFKGDEGEKGDRGADGPKVTSQNKCLAIIV